MSIIPPAQNQEKGTEKRILAQIAINAVASIKKNCTHNSFIACMHILRYNQHHYSPFSITPINESCHRTIDYKVTILYL